MALIEKQSIKSLEQTLTTGNRVLDGWTQRLLTATKESMQKREFSKLLTTFRLLPYLDLPEPIEENEQKIREILAINRTIREKREFVLEIGEQKIEKQGKSVGLLTLENLDKTRLEAFAAPIEEILSLGQEFLSPSDYQKKFINSSEASQREQIALFLAKNKAENQIISYVVPTITEADVERMVKKQEKETTRKESRGATQFGNHNGGKASISIEEINAPHQNLFRETQLTPNEIGYWANLPIKPLLIPILDNKTYDDLSKDPNSLARFLWEKVLYSPAFVDRNGKEVMMDEGTSNKYIDQIATFIKAGLPIRASEYTPLIAIPNPLKRRTQSITLAEIDFFRRLAEVAKTVELFYPQGLQWDVINEVPAFSEAFGLDINYVNAFHDAAQEIAESINSTFGRKVIHLTKMDDYLWGNEDRQKKWASYKEEKTRSMKEALRDKANLDHASIKKTIDMFTYPMATCINPFLCEAAKQLTMKEVVAVYEKLRQETGSVMRGVGMGNGADKDGFSNEQIELYDWLRQEGEQLSFNYRLTMDARDALPAFGEVNQTIKYTMVTKPNKPVLYPNSRRGSSFPAHGESILILNDGGWPTVTVKPWLVLLQNRSTYDNVPYFSQVTNDVLYFS